MPQVEAAAAAHSLSGSVPVVMLPQTPLVPPFFAVEHAWQRPVHAVEQQTPSTQKPLAHSFAAAHVEPVFFFARQPCAPAQ